MPKKSKGKSSKILVIVIVVTVLILAAVIGFLLTGKEAVKPVAESTPQEVRMPVKDQPLINFSGIEKDAQMQERKAEYGIDKGVDAIVKSDETIKIGDTTVAMQEIADKIRIQGGEIVEKNIEGGAGDIQVFGIYVVQPGDNMWNIHFQFLKDYFGNKGISISPVADEPDFSGFSSGVGKLLKFSENMVYIYNIKKHELVVDLSLIRPLSKIVIYNMDSVFALLESISYDNVNRIQFDGENIWIPAEQ